MMNHSSDRSNCDFLILGSGVAGLFSALKAARYGRVLIVTKKAAEECNTRYAQGGIACVTDKQDSFESHIQDTLTAGAGLCHPDVVRQIVTAGPERIRELIGYGIHFTRHGEISADGPDPEG